MKMVSGDRGDFSSGLLSDCENFANLRLKPNVKHYNDTSSFHAVFLAAERLGVHLQLLDMGGGFPGTAEAEVSFREISCRIKDSLAENFGSQL